MTKSLARIVDTVENFKNTSATAEAKEASHFVFVETETASEASQFAFTTTEEGEKVFLVEQSKLALGTINYSNFRGKLKDQFNLSSDQGLQVIGDSSLFSKSGHQYAIKLLEDLLKNHTGFLLYGFTSNDHGGANGVVEACLKKNPLFIFKVFANIVYPESIATVMKDPKCTYYEAVVNYLVVFDKKKTAGLAMIMSFLII